MLKSSKVVAVQAEIGRLIGKKLGPVGVAKVELVNAAAIGGPNGIIDGYPVGGQQVGV